MLTLEARIEDAFLERCLSPTVVLAKVPGIKPRAAYQIFENRCFNARINDPDEDFPLSKEDLHGAVKEHIHKGFERRVMTPNGARLARRMIEAGLLPFVRKSDAQNPDFTELDAFIAAEAVMMDEARVQAAAEHAFYEGRKQAFEELKERARVLAQNPELAELSEISEALIDQVFLTRNGYGSGGTITLGGAICHKTLDYYVSNSRKNRSTNVRIWWEMPDGTVRGTPDAPKPNRRSDPDRNWGLGRE